MVESEFGSKSDENRTVYARLNVQTLIKINLPINIVWICKLNVEVCLCLCIVL